MAKRIEVYLNDEDETEFAYRQELAEKVLARKVGISEVALKHMKHSYKTPIGEVME